MAKSEKIPMDEAMVDIVRQCGPALLEALQSKFGCTAVFHLVDVASGAGPSRKRGEERFSIQLPRGLKVSVWKDDLTTHRVDAVVNAANVNLQHGAGLARALCDAGGPAIQSLSNKHVQTYGRLSTGDAIVTEPGSLDCKKIIHAVGPELPYRPTKQMVQQARSLLEKAVKSILSRVEEEKLQTVAIPALSSGLFNFPLPQCADVIVTTLKSYDGVRRSSPPLEVRLVNHDEASVTEMKRACCELLGSSSMPSYSHVLANHGASSNSTQDQGKGYNSAHGQGKGYNSHSQTASSYEENFTKPQTSTVQIENVSLTLKTGNIEKEMVDVIVNTTSENLQLSIGEISKAISQAAGSQMQDEIGYSKATTGGVLVTKGYRLHSKQVYHTVCARNDGYSAKKVLHGPSQVLHEVIIKCLQMASGSGHNSISFPAIGTGNLGFQKPEVAQVMTRALADFANKYQGKRMDVYFVIYPTDISTLEAFKEQLRSLQDTGKHSGSTHTTTQGLEYTDNYRDSRATRQTVNPHMELSGACVETLKEAEQWILSVLCPPADFFHIQNNFIMHFGQREHDELLSLQAKWRVTIDMFFQNCHAGLIIKGERRGISGAVLELEALCCRVQEEFAKDEESLTMPLLQSTRSSAHHRKPIDDLHSQYKDGLYLFRELEITRVERVDNQDLKQLFDLKKKQLQISGPGQKMFQRLPAQFCDLVCRVGCQREYAPPADQKYGEGIYFSGSVSGALQLGKDIPEEEYLYFIEARVLKGTSTVGSPGLIVPPSRGSDPLHMYDSVTGGTDTCVIFNGHQALPEYLVTCKKPRAKKYE